MKGLVAFIVFAIVFGGLGIWLPVGIYGTAAFGNWFFYVWALIIFVTSGAQAGRFANGEPLR